MQFLRTLFWVVLAMILVLFASVNWHAVSVRLWGGLIADVKLPVLILGAFLAGFLPTLLILRARIWTLQRRLEGYERQAIAAAQMPPPPEPEAPPAPQRGDRIATDSSVWPTA